MSPDKKHERRQHMRFPPDDIEIARIHFTDAEPDPSSFRTETAGLVIKEAYGGAGLVALSHSGRIDIREGARCNVMVGNLGPLQAEVRWVKKLDDDIYKLGIEYLDAG